VTTPYPALQRWLRRRVAPDAGRSGNSPGGFRVVAPYPFANARKALADLLMGKTFTPPQGFLAALHNLDEARIFLKIAGNSALHQFVGIAALLGCGVRQRRSSSGGKCTPMALAP
jgi:hypothetical protein